MSKLRILALLCFLGASCCAVCQSKADKEFEKAVNMIVQRELGEAEALLQKIVSKYPDYTPAYLALGELYYAQQDTDRAKQNLLSVVQSDPKYDMNAYRKLANIYSDQKQWDSAVVFLESYLSFAPNNESFAQKRNEVQRQIDCILFRKQAYGSPVEFNPENLGSNVNTVHLEYLPTIMADQSELLFTRQSLPEGGKAGVEDFYISTQTANGWAKAEKLSGVLNSDYNEGAACLSPDGRYIYFTRCHAPKGLGNCDIYRSERNGTQWAEAENLGANVNSSAWDAQPSIASDGRTLFFVSNRKGGLGESDIYYSYLKDDGTWTRAKNCGEPINTPGKEITPFIHPSNQTLYFSSDYHCGLGGLDIFYSRLENGKFSAPINIGYPINTEAEESSFVVTPLGDMAIYASERLEGLGGLDLYQFELYQEARPIAATYVKGKITSKADNRPIKARFEIRNIKNGLIVSSGYSDGVSGDYLACLPVGSQYAFSAKAEGYLFYSDGFSLVGNDGKEAFEKDIQLERVEIGKSIVLNNIFFETNSSTLMPESSVELATLIKLLEENPNLKVEIEGHTDNIGEADYNLELSKRRAEAVKTYLVEKGIALERLSSKGYGFSKPITDNSTEQARALNRRTEIRIIGK